jgi:hypothetical protein
MTDSEPPDDADLADLDVPALRRSLNDLGYAIARKLLRPDDLDRLRRTADACAPDQSLRAQYNQSGDPKRYEYQLTTTTTTTPRDDDDDGGGGRRLARLASALCPDLVRAESFCIVSEPGSADQPPHTDSIPCEDDISAEDWRRERTYLGVLAPLAATTDATGKTAVTPRSHRVDAAADPEIRVALAAGDALLLDGRTTHRGLANTSNEEDEDEEDERRTRDRRVRRMCFFTFKRPGITDGNAAAYLSDDGSDDARGDDGGDDAGDDGSAEEEEEEREEGSERGLPAAKKARRAASRR